MQRFEPMVAVDVETKQEALRLFDKLSSDTDHQPIVKIGMELYYAFGPGIVREAKGRGLTVFLDLKLYDIPNTVERTMRVLGALGASFVTTHAAGGTEMMKAAKRGLLAGAAAAGRRQPKLLAVTKLTSIDEQILHDEQKVAGTLIEAVQNAAHLTEAAGLDGVICSAQEVEAIRLNLDNKDDQKRVVTPAQARELGSNAIVVGRPITLAKDPMKAYNEIRQDFMGEQD